MKRSGELRPLRTKALVAAQEAQERDLKRGLLVHLRQFPIEMCRFRLVGSQVPFEVGGEDYFKIDLLFYHLKLRRDVVIDLKMTPFKPEYAGKKNFYLAAVNDRSESSIYVDGRGNFRRVR